MLFEIGRIGTLELPNRLRDGLQERAACISGNRCWPDSPGEGIACRCPTER